MERSLPKHLISVLSFRHSAKWDVGVVPDPTTGITALEIEEELFGQETLFVPGVSNWQSVSGSLEPTSKKKHQGWGGIWVSVTPRLRERVCSCDVHFVTFMSEQLFLDSVGIDLPFHATTSQLHYHLQS